MTREFWLGFATGFGYTALLLIVYYLGENAGRYSK